jgi:hypothetical protein
MGRPPPPERFPIMWMLITVYAVSGAAMLSMAVASLFFKRFRNEWICADLT